MGLERKSVTAGLLAAEHVIMITWRGRQTHIAAILLFLFMVHTLLAPVLNLLHFTLVLSVIIIIIIIIIIIECAISSITTTSSWNETWPVTHCSLIATHLYDTPSARSDYFNPVPQSCLGTTVFPGPLFFLESMCSLPYAFQSCNFIAPSRCIRTQTI